MPRWVGTQHRCPCLLPSGKRLVLTVDAMAASSFSRVSTSVAVGLRPLKDVMVCPCRESMTASRVDIVRFDGLFVFYLCCELFC